jgi:hypothetical protein
MRKLAQIRQQAAHSSSVVAIGRGITRGVKLLSGPLEVGSDARKVNACGAIESRV